MPETLLGEAEQPPSHGIAQRGQHFRHLLRAEAGRYEQLEDPRDLATRLHERLDRSGFLHLGR